MTRRRLVELLVLGVAVGSAVVFAVLWARTRSSSADGQEILVIDLSAARNADVNMPYPIRVLDRRGKKFAGFDHHGVPQALPIPASRYPIIVVAGFDQCRSNKVKAAAVAVVEVGLNKQGCVAWQIE